MNREDKPEWKLEAERAGDSLPEYWTMQEVAHKLDIALTYPAKLCKKYHISTYKIGQVRFISSSNLSMLEESIKKF